MKMYYTYYFDYFNLIFQLIGKSLLYLILFIICISFLGITTGIRKVYVQSLIWLFEWTARQEKYVTATAEEESSEEEGERSASTCRSRSNSSTSTSRELSPVESISAIIQRKASHNIERKLVEHIDEHNIHPLAQRATKRVASHSRGLHQLAEEGGLPKTNSDNDAEYATVKVIVNDTLEMLTAGIEAIIEDEVTHRFEAAQLPTWNFLSRNRGGLRVGWRSQCIWAIGAFLRYFLLFPVRLVLLLISSAMMVTLPAIIGSIRNDRIRRLLYRKAMLMCMRMSARIFSTIVTFHDTQNRPKHGICVANHTSPIDVLILSTDNNYAMVGQRHGGVLGLIQRAISRGSHHIWFERSESKDRQLVAKRLRDHAEDPTRMPMLIFPEGTCINNTSVMQFKKGSFEIAATVYPIAMKYDNRLGDPFWNSHKQGYGTYLLSLLTAWALICEVWYLPPMHRQEGESSIEFARRCQRAIARRGGLVDLGWDGNLKRTKVPEKLRDEQRELFFQYLAQTTPICACGKPNSEQMENVRKEIHPEVYQTATPTVQVQAPVVEQPQQRREEAAEAF